MMLLALVVGFGLRGFRRQGLGIPGLVFRGLGFLVAHGSRLSPETTRTLTSLKTLKPQNPYDL